MPSVLLNHAEAFICLIVFLHRKTSCSVCQGIMTTTYFREVSYDVESMAIDGFLLWKYSSQLSESPGKISSSDALYRPQTFVVVLCNKEMQAFSKENKKSHVRIWLDIRRPGTNVNALISQSYFQRGILRMLNFLVLVECDVGLPMLIHHILYQEDEKGLVSEPYFAIFG